MSKWKCEICGNEFDNFHAQGFDNKIYCPLCYFKKENQELKKQVEQYQQELEKADSITQSCIFNGKEESKISYRKCLNILDKKEAQQKEFIEYLEDLIKQNETVVEVSKYGLPKNCSKLLIDFYKEILSKYREIIGSDINVGSIGDKDE